MSDHRDELMLVAKADKRIALEAYEFLCHALMHTQRSLGRAPIPTGSSGNADDTPRHITGRELLEGVRQFAIEQFGMMAFAVFRSWGLRRTDDIGDMVFRLVDAGLWRKTENDSPKDFEDVYDFQKAFVDDFRIEWDDA